MTGQTPPKAFPSIHGRCPACRGDSLFIGAGGWVTCSRLNCPNPSAADELLHGDHVTAATPPAPPGPAATQATEAGEIQLSRKLGHGLIVDHAPKHTRMALALLNMPSCGAGMVNADQINIADQVLYQVVGYDPASASLLLELVEDWRPKPGATLTEADVEELKARRLATYGNNQGAHPVVELRPANEEEQPNV